MLIAIDPLAETRCGKTLSLSIAAETKTTGSCTAVVHLCQIEWWWIQQQMSMARSVFGVDISANLFGSLSLKRNSILGIVVLS